MGFFVKNKNVADTPYTSALIHRESTLESKGIEPIYNSNINNFDKLAKNEKLLAAQIN